MSVTLAAQRTSSLMSSLSDTAIKFSHISSICMTRRHSSVQNSTLLMIVVFSIGVSLAKVNRFFMLNNKIGCDSDVQSS